MKKFCGLLLLLCLIIGCPLTVFAEKTDWSDSSYDFSKAKRILVYDVELTDKSEFDNDLLDDILQEDYWKMVGRLGNNVLRSDRAESLSPSNPQAVADVYVTAELLQWHDDFYIKPEYTTWERKSITRDKRRSDGSKEKETTYITVPVVHPPRRVDTSTVRMRFDVYDAKTGKRVMARDEVRVRDDSHRGEKGIFGRICKAFFDDFGKKLKGK